MNAPNAMKLTAKVMNKATTGWPLVKDQAAPTRLARAATPPTTSQTH